MVRGALPIVSALPSALWVCMYHFGVWNKVILHAGRQAGRQAASLTSGSQAGVPCTDIIDLLVSHTLQVPPAGTTQTHTLSGWLQSPDIRGSRFDQR